MRLFYNIISIIFHPVFILTYVFILLSQINPYIFGGNNFHALFRNLFYVILQTVVIPLVAVLTLKQVGLISSFSMEDKLERTGPFLVSGLFLIWLFLNAWKGNEFPIAYTVFILGSVLALFFSFFVNIFFKTSLHTAGMGGLVGGMFLFLVFFKYKGPLALNLLGFSMSFSTEVLLLISIVLAGLVGAARLYLKAHDNYQLMSGYFIGFSAQIIALKVLSLLS